MYAVIDIGSNSVRIMFHDGKNTIFKTIKTTKLADGLAQTGRLSEDAIHRSVKAVIDCIELAQKEYNIKPYIFATEAVRSAENGYVFTDSILEKTGIKVDVVDGKEEARLGFIGAYNGGRACIVDIGGASTEIVVGDEKGIQYAKSLKIGAVRLRDICGEDEEKLEQYLSEQLENYGEIPKSDEVIAIGGTASTLAAVALKLKIYDSSRVHNYILTEQVIKNCYSAILSVPVSQRVKIDGLSAGREDIIIGAMYELLQIMKKLGVDKVRVSESDNLEGYLKTNVLGN